MAWLLYSAALWAWQMPVFYEGALRGERLREAERYVQSATSIPQANRARGRSARFGGIGPE